MPENNPMSYWKNEKNTRAELIKKHTTKAAPKSTPANILDLVTGEGNAQPEGPPLFGPGNPAAAKAERWQPKGSK
jgi:hypothetical protein